MKYFALFFFSGLIFFSTHKINAQTQASFLFKEYEVLNNFYTEYLDTDKVDSDAASYQLLDCFKQLVRCLNDDSAASRFQIYALGEALFFATHIYNTPNYISLSKEYAAEMKKAKDAVEKFLQSYFANKTGAELYFILEISGAKRQTLQIDFNLPQNVFFPSLITLDIPLALQNFDQSQKRILYYRTLEQSNSYFLQYNSKQIASFFENPYLLFAINNTDINFENRQKFLLDLKNYIDISVEKSKTKNPKNAYSYSTFTGFFIAQASINKMQKDAATFYNFNANLKHLTALSMQYGIPLNALFATESVKYLNLLNSDDFFLLFLYKNAALEKTNQKILQQASIISHFAPRYHKLKYKV
ncbi:MAG: hypothetical protein ACRC5H_05545 [Treponemataceae bacterium]